MKLKLIKVLYLLLLMLIGISVMAGCNSESSPKTASGKSSNDQAIKIGWQPSMEAQFYVAKDQKLFEENGLKPEYTKFTAGPPMFAAFNSGSIDVAYMGGPPSIIAMSQDLPVSIIAVEVDASNGEGLVVNPQSGIKTIEDLKGKKIAVARGSSAEAAMMTGLEKFGMDANDVKIIDLDVTTIIPAFQKGDVDGVWVWEPWLSKLETAGGKVITTDAEVGFNMFGVWVARNEWIKENPAAVKAFITSLTDANGIISTDKEKSTAILSTALELETKEAEGILNKVSFPTVDQLLDKDYLFSMNPSAIKEGKGIVTTATMVAEFLKEKGSITEVPDVKKYIDPTILEELSKK
jgi:aliphatic sulfonates family ABC transporter substrate-binding protein